MSLNRAYRDRNRFTTGMSHGFPADGLLAELLCPDEITRLIALVDVELESRMARWRRSSRVAIFDELTSAYSDAVFRWAGSRRDPDQNVGVGRELAGVLDAIVANASYAVLGTLALGQGTTSESRREAPYPGVGWEDYAHEIAQTAPFDQEPEPPGPLATVRTEILRTTLSKFAGLRVRVEELGPQLCG